MMQLGNFLKQYRKEFRITGREFAEQLGVKNYALEKWENRGDTPNADDAEKLKNFFSVKSLRQLDHQKFEDLTGLNLDSSTLNKETQEKLIEALEMRIFNMEQLIEAKNGKIELLENKLLIYEEMRPGKRIERRKKV